MPRGRVILDGAGDATNIAAVGGDNRLAETLPAVHYYTFFAGTSTDESQWANGIPSLIGGYASRTVATEWGAPMSPGSKNGVHYDAIDHDVAGAEFSSALLGGPTATDPGIGSRAEPIEAAVSWAGRTVGGAATVPAATATG